MNLSRLYRFVPGAVVLLSAALASDQIAPSQGLRAQSPTAPAAEAPTPEEVELQKQLRQLDRELELARASGIRAVKVNGKVLSPEQVRREVIFLVGAKIVKAKIGDFFIDEWKQQAIEGGRKPEEFEISEAKVMKELAGQVDEFRKKNPGVEFWEAVRSLTGLTKDGYMQQRRQTELFDLVFFPGPANKWPSITKEAIMASASGGNGKEFWDNIEKSSIGEDGKPRALPPFWMQLCRGWVQKQLEKWSDIRYPSDGLPAEQVLSVNGKTWDTESAFKLVRPGLFIQDIERAMAEVVLREALKQSLTESGHYLDDAAFRTEYQDYAKEYDDTPFNTEVIATAFKGYPSLEAFRQRWRLMKSFENMIAKEINDDSLKAHGEKFARFFADGETNVDAIQFLARDIKTGAWVPGGFDAAKKRAEAALAELKDGRSFDEVLEGRGEFYSNDTERGRYGSKSLNQLRQALSEFEFTDLVLGYSVGNFLFYEAEVGKIVGPLRGPNGYYLARVNSRTPARGGVTITDARTRELVKQDYVNHRFHQWANEVLQTAKIEPVQ